MATDVDVCNLALAHLGDEATVASIDPSDGSQQADYCVRFYPVARDQLLGMHAWSFATKRIPLALLDAGDELPVEWKFCYATPDNCINVIAILMPGAVVPFSPFDCTNQFNVPRASDPQPYIQETLQDGTKVIFTNAENAIARYVFGVTDTLKFSSLFVTACARLLSAYLAGPMIKGDMGRKVAADIFKLFLQTDLPLATGMDTKAQQQNLYNNFIPDALKMRQ